MSARRSPRSHQSSRREGRQIDRRIMAAVMVIIAATTACGCNRSFQRHRASLREELSVGHYPAIAQTLDQAARDRAYSERNRLLWTLDRGTVALALDDQPTTLQVLSEAEQIMDQRRRQHPLETAGGLLISDQLTPYLGEPYEDIYVNVLKMLAHLERGSLQGGATVEARRIAAKVDLLRDEYLAQRQRTQFANRMPTGSVPAPSGSFASTRDGEFIDSPLGTYLTAVTFMHTGDRANQAVAARRLQQAVRSQGSLIGPVDPSAFENLGSLSANKANVLVVALSGQGPYKVPHSVGPMIIDGTPIYFELPILKIPRPSVHSVQVRTEAATAGTPAVVEADLIEDPGQVAYENHRRQLPLTYVRTVARAAAKSWAIHQAGRLLDGESHHEGGGQLLTAMAGMALLTATEQADLRGWTMLPGRAHVSLLELPPGPHEVVVEFRSHHGQVAHRSPPRQINVSANGLTTVVEHYWR